MRDVDWGRIIGGLLTLAALALWIIAIWLVPWPSIRYALLGLLCACVAAVIVKASEE